MDKTEIEMNMNVELVDLEDGTFQIDGSQEDVENFAITLMREQAPFEFDGELLIISETIIEGGE